MREPQLPSDMSKSEDPLEEAKRLAREASVKIFDGRPDRSQEDEALELVDREIKARQASGDGPGEAVALCALGEINAMLNRYEEARRAYQEAQSVFARVGDHAGEAEVWLDLGKSEWISSKNEEARAHFRQAREIFAHIGDLKKQGECLNWLAYCFDAKKETDSAVEAYEESLALCRRAEHAEGAVTAISRLVPLYRRLGRHDEAESLADELPEIAEKIPEHAAATYRLMAFSTGEMVHGYVGREKDFDSERERRARKWLESARKKDDSKDLAHALFDLAHAMSSQKRHGEARQALLEALELYQEIGDREGEASAHSSLGLMETHAGNYDAARKHFGFAIAHYRQQGAHNSLIHELSQLGHLEEEAENYEQALAAYSEAGELHKQSGDERGEAWLLASLAGVERKRGRLQQAHDAYQQAWALCRRADDRNSEIGIIRNLADLEHARSHNDRARALYERARKLFQDMEEPHGEGYTLRDLGDMERAFGEHEAANSAYETARELFEQIGDLQGQASMSWKLGYLHRERDPVSAKQHYLASAELYQRLGNENMERKAKARAAQL
jgi:tetratricopeptide (TPR) repeat protein